MIHKITGFHDINADGQWDLTIDFGAGTSYAYDRHTRGTPAEKVVLDTGEHLVMGETGVFSYKIDTTALDDIFLTVTYPDDDNYQVKVVVREGSEQGVSWRSFNE